MARESISIPLHRLLKSSAYQDRPWVLVLSPGFVASVGSVPGDFCHLQSNSGTVPDIPPVNLWLDF